MTLQHTKIPHLSHHISRSWMPLGAVNCRHTDGEANPGPPANHGAWTQCNGNPGIVVMLALYCTLVMRYDNIFIYIYNIILYYIYTHIDIDHSGVDGWVTLGQPLDLELTEVKQASSNVTSNIINILQPLQDIRSSAQAPNISGGTSGCQKLTLRCPCGNLHVPVASPPRPLNLLQGLMKSMLFGDSILSMISLGRFGLLW